MVVLEGGSISFFLKLTALAVSVLIVFGTWEYLGSGTGRVQTVSVDPSEIDFGELQQNTECTATVTLRNTLSSTIVIAGFSKRCDCTTASADSQTLEPGAVTTVRLKWKTRLDRGRVDFPVIVLCKRAEDTERTFAVPIRCGGFVTAKYDYSPEWLTFRVQRSDENKLRFVRSGSQPPSRIVCRAWATHRSLDVKQDEQPGETIVTVRFDANKWIGGPGTASIVADIDPSSGGGTLVIPVNIVVESPKTSSGEP